MAHNGMRDGRRRQTVRRLALAASVAGALAVIVPAAALAGQIMQTASYGPQATNWSNASLNFNGFDSTLGPLQSVKLTVMETLNGSASLTDTATTGTSPETTQLTLTNDGVVVGGGPGINISASNAQTTPQVTLSPGESSPTYPLSGSSSQAQTFYTLLSFFESPFVLTAGDSGSESLSGGGANTNITFTDNGQVSVTALYTYGTSVPEPSSLLLLGTGLMGLGMVMSRRRRMF